MYCGMYSTFEISNSSSKEYTPNCGMHGALKPGTAMCNARLGVMSIPVLRPANLQVAQEYFSDIRLLASHSCHSKTSQKIPPRSKTYKKAQQK
ncbi:hypothetical protein E2C01_102742 [Portunus trituberculatus]|uniref:Uncharacterized protein n=1 Tax=Portunus trituberculatus TaxID=210409 RepID=A0A5B7KN98_PORTR|nr:hypothetical protein [Portunus trituberculatus]